MLEKKSLEDEIKKIIKSISKSSEIRLDMSFKDLGMDSLGIIRMLAEIQEKGLCNFDETNNESFNFSTIGDFIHWVEEQAGLLV